MKEVIQSGWGRGAFGCFVLLVGVLLGTNKSTGQTFSDNQTLFSNQDTNQETRRSDHFRVVFGHYGRDPGQGGMTEAMAQGNLQEFEWMWHRWVVEDGLLNINTSALQPNPMPGNYRANFWFLLTENDGGGGGSYNSMDGNGFFWAMGNTSLERFDPYGGVAPHEWGDCWWGTAGGYLGSVVGGNLDECMGNWGMLQFLNTYPQAPDYLANGMYTPIHGRDYFNSWPIFEMAIQTPGYGYPYINAIFSETNATAQQQVNEYFINRMIRLDPSGSADKRGAVNDLWGEMARRLVTWDFQRQQWLAQANAQNGQGSADPGTAWSFYQHCRTPLIPMAGTPGWYRPGREHLPQEFGWNIIPLQATNGTTVTCNFQPQCDPVRQSDWRACFVAVDNNGGASYSTKWNVGTNSFTLSADQNQLYLVVIATPLPIGTEVMSDWWAYLEFAGLQFPYALSFSNATPLNVVEGKPASGVTWKSHVNTLDGTICQNIASTATVAGTAYVGSNAMVLGSAQVLNSASVQDYAVVRDSAVVSGNAVVSGHGEVRDNAVVSGFAKVRDWGRVYGYAQISGYGKVIEHANCGDGSAGAGNYTTVSGSAIIKGTTYVYAPSTFNGCLIMDGDSSDGNGTTPASYGVHFGWQWGDNSTSWWSALPNNNYQYCGLTFENTQFTQNSRQYGISNNPVFAVDQYGINHGFLMNGCRSAIDSGGTLRGGYVLALNGVNQYVELHNSVNDFNDTTIAVWFKNTGGAVDQRIWSMGDGTNKVMYLTPNDGTTGNLRFIITDGTTTNYLNGGGVPVNTWTQVAVVFAQAAGNCVLYVNGLPVATNSAITLFPDSLNAPLMANANYLGRGNAGNYFQGNLDDFRVFMRSFAASDVLALYNTPAPAAVTPVTDAPPATPAWLVAPNAVSDSALTMSAVQATSTLGWGEYYFHCTSGGGHDSGWVSFNKYTDCNLAPGTSYDYTVTMRDQSGHVTTASSPAGATTLTSSIGSGAAGFAYGPVGIANGQITMTAATVANASGKTEYKFDCAGNSSGWQASPSWTETGLTTGGSYIYTVTVRDGRGNTSTPSAGVNASAADQAAPLFPSFQQGQWFTMPYPTITNTISMTAATATDPGGVQYYFHCTVGGAPDSGWQSSPTYVTPALTNGSYGFQYLLRDQSPQTNQSGYSTTYTATIKPTTGYQPCTFGQLTTLPDDDLVTFTGTVIAVNPTSYVVRDTNSTATITVWPNTYAETTDSSLALMTVSVSGHLYTYTNNGGRLVSYASLSTISGPAYSISGVVTNANGVALAGVNVYISSTPNASVNPVETVITGANGAYTAPIVNGAWHVCAGSSTYGVSADQIVAVNSANVANVNFSLASNPVLSGAVTDTSGNPISGATVYLSPTPNASASPLYTAITSASGLYSLAVQGATLYVCAGAGNYLTSADQLVTATSNVASINFALAPNPLNGNVPQTNQLFFSVVTDPFSSSGLITNWPTYLPAGQNLAGQGITLPSVQNVAGRKWAGITNTSGVLMGFLQGTYSSPIPCSGATIVAVVIPHRNTTHDAWDAIVSLFYNRLVLGAYNDTGQLVLMCNGNISTPSGTIPNNQATVLSMVVQTNGHYIVWTNGVPFYTNNTTSTLTNLVPNVAGPFANTINLGNDGPDGWSTFSGNIGDVFVYTNALSTASRQQLEQSLLAGFGANGARTISATAGIGGSLIPNGAVTVLSGSNQTFTITPSANQPGWSVSNVVVDGVSQGALSSYSFTNVTANHTISAAFQNSNPLFTISASAWPGGTISPAGSVPVISGSNQIFTITPNAGYNTDVSVDGVDQGAINAYTFTNITTNHSITAVFSPVVLMIAASAGPGSAISPAGGVPVGYGLSQTFGFTPGSGNDVWVDGVDQGTLGSYAFTNVTTNHVITVAFNPAISVNYDIAGTSTPAEGSAAAAGLVAVNNWNDISSTGSGGFTAPTQTFYDSTGTSVSPFTVKLSNNNNASWNTVGNANQVLFGDWALNGGGTLTLNNVPYSSYNLYVYFTGFPPGPNVVNYTISGKTKSMTNTMGSPNNFTAFVPGNNYVEFTNLTGSGQVMTVAGVSGGSCGVSAFQIVDATAACTITASAGTGGTISPSGSVPVSHGSNQTFAIAPLAGYTLTNTTVDGVSQGAVSSYTFTNVVVNHAIAATFAAGSLAPPTLAISTSAGGGLKVTWPDSYTNQLLWSTNLGQNAVWTPVGGTPAHVGGFFQATVTPNNAATYYGLSR